MTNSAKQRRLLWTRKSLLVAVVAGILACAAFELLSRVSIPSMRPIQSVNELDQTRAGAAIALVKDGRTIFESTVGIAERSRQIRITGATAFDLASVSKQFTAYAVLVLEQDGLIDRKAPLNAYFHDLPDWAEHVKVSDLLFHTGGLPDVRQWCGPFGRSTNADILKRLQTRKNLKFAPGERFEYSNTGYAVLASLVEQVSGKAFPKFLQERIFTPLGMKSTMVFSSDSRSNIPDRAKSYNAWPFTLELDETACGDTFGDGGVYSNLNDYRLWLKELEQPTLLEPQRWKTALASGLSIREGLSYSYGWAISKSDGHTQIEHRGSWLGFRSYVIGVPDARAWLIFLANSPDVDREAIITNLLSQFRTELGIGLTPRTLTGF